MDKPNVFKTSDFYMSAGDVLHVSIKYADGSDTVDLDLVAGDSGVVSDSSTYRVTDKDGNLYTTVIIGTQEWIAESLMVTQYADGSPIPNLTLNADWIAEDGTAGHDGAYCWYDNNIANKAVYGALYNWYAVDNAAGLVYLERGGVQDATWRVPTRADYEALIAYLGGGSVAANKLKTVGLDFWEFPNNGTNESLFSGKGSGQRRFNTGVFSNKTISGLFWSTTDDGFFNADRMLLQKEDAVVSSNSYAYGFSVRLVRDI
jgi:uncharacterized protein (TIGR02145 family)